MTTGQHTQLRVVRCQAWWCTAPGLWRVLTTASPLRPAAAREPGRGGAAVRVPADQESTSPLPYTCFREEGGAGVHLVHGQRNIRGTKVRSYSSASNTDVALYT